MAEQAAAKQATKQLQYNQRAAPHALGQTLGSIMNFVGSLYGGKGGYMTAQNPSTAPQNYGTPTSQYGGLLGTASNVLGGNLHWGGDQGLPYMGGMPSDVSNPGYPMSNTSYSTAPYESNIAPNPWGG
jgi:hypothetical protein